MPSDGADRPFGYDEAALRRYFDQFDRFTAAATEQRLERLRRLLAQTRERTFISLGENCASGIKLREIGAATTGGHFFDNIVIGHADIPALLYSRFADILHLRDLEIGRWEGQDSVYDRRCRIFYHHYFYLRGADEKDAYDDAGQRRRRIDPADIPLFLGSVRSQFEYLAEKFALVAQAPLPKTYVLRAVPGGPLAPEAYGDLQRALTRFGAVNFDIAVIHSHGEPDAAITASHVSIPDTDSGTRWGELADWADFAAAWRNQGLLPGRDIA